jgi:Ca2+-binding EF-hand superfamily protein
LSKRDLQNGLLNDERTSQVSRTSVAYNQVLGQCDFDGDGKLDFNEFIQAAICQKTIMNEENLDKIFQLFDVNGEQQISIKSLTSLFSDKV